MTINPAIPDYEPSPAARRFANRNGALWGRARELLGPLQTIFLELEENDAAPPFLMDRSRPCGVYPEEFTALIENLFSADFSACWADDAEAEDRRLNSQHERKAP